MTKEINIDGKAYTIKANALLPRKYRTIFGKDIVSELNRFVETCKSVSNTGYADLDYTVAENITWLMIKTADDNAVGTIEEFLSGIDDAFAIMKAFPSVMELWAESQQTTSVPRKK